MKTKNYEDGLLAGLRIALRIVQKIHESYTINWNQTRILLGAIDFHIQNIEELKKEKKK